MSTASPGRPFERTPTLLLLAGRRNLRLRYALNWCDSPCCRLGLALGHATSPFASRNSRFVRVFDSPSSGLPGGSRAPASRRVHAINLSPQTLGSGASVVRIAAFGTVSQRARHDLAARRPGASIGLALTSGLGWPTRAKASVNPLARIPFHSTESDSHLRRRQGQVAFASKRPRTHS